MPNLTRIITRVQDNDDIQAPAAGSTDSGKIWAWNSSTSKFEPAANIVVSSGQTTITGQPSAEDSPSLIVQRTFSGTAAAPAITALFRNTGDSAGGSDYQNEVHVRLQAGTSANHRRYINFAGYDGVDDWLTGANASDVWILYDANTPVHRLWFENSSGSGHSYINSTGSGAVIVNGLVDGTNNAGTDGLIIRSGGASPQTLFDFDGSGTLSIGSAVAATRYLAYVSGSRVLNTGASQGGLLVNTTYTPAADSSSTFVGINANPVASGNFNPNSLTAVSGIATHNAAAASATLIGGLFVAQNIVGQTITNVYAGQFQIQNTHASGTLTTASAVYVLSPTNSGTLGIYYGVRVLDASAVNLTVGVRSSITSGSNKYNLYIDGTANSAITGKMFLGSITTPTAQLDITGSTTSAASLRIRSGTAPTSPNDGDIWYPTSGRLTLRRGSTSELFATGVQATGGSATSGIIYTSTEQSMLQKAYDACRAFGLLT